MKYNWQLKDWPNFTYSTKRIEDSLLKFIHKVGKVSGLIEGLPQTIQTEAIVEIMVNEAVKSFEIEGEYLNRIDVMSSVKKNLGLSADKNKKQNQKAKNAADLMHDVRKTYKEKLNQQKLFCWHRMIIMEGNTNVRIGSWRTHKEPMHIVSGPVGKEKIHFEAPPSRMVPIEMKRFILWFNKSYPVSVEDSKNAPLRSAISHIYFESIHPFEDGNGRIGRALSEKTLSQGINQPVILSLSNTLEQDKSSYYEALKIGQRSNDITDWIYYFVNIILKAQTQAEVQIEHTLKKTKFLDRYRDIANTRQLKVINRMLEAGPAGFRGGMTAKKYISITKTSKATATRDLQDLTSKNALISGSSGRSTSYQINLE